MSGSDFHFRYTYVDHPAMLQIIKGSLHCRRSMNKNFPAAVNSTAMHSSNLLLSEIEGNTITRYSKYLAVKNASEI
jgi:hypothetical protein